MAGYDGNRVDNQHAEAIGVPITLQVTQQETAHLAGWCCIHYQRLQGSLPSGSFRWRPHITCLTL